MVRQYKRKRPGQWRDKDKRMTLAVQSRAEGKSLREIAKELAVSYQTVANDLARWERERPNVIPLSNSAVKSDPGPGRDLTPEFDSKPTVIQLRRTQGGHA